MNSIFKVPVWLFLIGIFGLITSRKNVIMVLLSIELMLLGINFFFATISSTADELNGQVFSLVILTIAAAESAIGLAILIISYRIRNSVDLDFIDRLKG